MKKILLAVGLVMASMSFTTVASTNNSNDVVVVGNGTGSVQVSQCASAWTCNNSSLNVSFEGDVDKVYVDGKATVIKGKDGKDGKDGINGTNGIDGTNGKDGINGLNGKDGINGIDGKDGATGAKGDKGDTGATGADGRDGINGSNGLDGKDGQNGIDGSAGLNGDAGANGTNGTDGSDGKDADMSVVNANKAAIAAQQQELRNVNKQFSSLKETVEDNHKKANAGIAGVAAMANIPQVTESARFSLGAGLGFRGNEQAVAVGMSSRLSQSVIGKLSVAADTQSEFTVGTGIAVQW